MQSMAAAAPHWDSVDAWRVAWTRGDSCRPVAELLADELGRRIDDDLHQACIEDRIDILVTRKLTSFDLVPLVVPQSVNLDEVEFVSAAVSDGPHSELAVAVAARISDGLGVPGEIATAYRTEDDAAEAVERLDRLGGPHPRLRRRTVMASTAAAVVEPLGPETLLVLGAAGGSWLQRQLFGPGHKLAVAAPGGFVIVRNSPRRVFQETNRTTSHVAGPHLNADEALRLFPTAIIPVADGGKLIGIARRRSLREASDGTTLGDLMEPAVSVSADEPIEAAAELRDFFDGAPIPVVDGQGNLIGSVAPRP